MQALQRLRIATAVAHRVPAASLTVTWRDVTDSVITHDTAEPANLCEFRHLVAGADQFRPDPFVSRMNDVRVGAGLVDLGGGIYADGCPLVSRTRWIATFLAPDDVRERIERCSVDGESSQAGSDAEEPYALGARRPAGAENTFSAGAWRTMHVRRWISCLRTARSRRGTGRLRPA